MAIYILVSDEESLGDSIEELIDLTLDYYRVSIKDRSKAPRQLITDITLTVSDATSNNFEELEAHFDNALTNHQIEAAIEKACFDLADSFDLAMQGEDFDPELIARIRKDFTGVKMQLGWPEIVACFKEAAPPAH